MQVSVSKCERVYAGMSVTECERVCPNMSKWGRVRASVTLALRSVIAHIPRRNEGRRRWKAGVDKRRE